MTPLSIVLRSADRNTDSIDVAGRISRDGWQPNHDPLVARLGPDVYTSTILLNLRNADSIDSTGVEWLLSRHSRCEQAGGRLVLQSPSPMTEQLLRIVRMDLSAAPAPSKKLPDCADPMKGKWSMPLPKTTVSTAAMTI